MSEATAEQVTSLRRSRGRSITSGALVIWLVVALVAISLPYWMLTSQFAIGVAVLVFACLALGWNLIGGFEARSHSATSCFSDSVRTRRRCC